jgi:hypothetical protein
LADKSPRQQEIVKLLYGSHPTKRYNDERVHAASLWQHYSRSQVKRYRALKAQLRGDDANRKRGISPAQAAYRDTRNMTGEQRKQMREREQIRTQAYEFAKSEQERWKRLAKGPESFPIDEKLKEIEARYKLENWGEQMNEYVRAAGLPVSGEREYHFRAVHDFKVNAVRFHTFLSDLKKREACELVLWGQAEAETLQEIAFFEARLRYLTAIARRAIEKEKAKLEQEAAERRRSEEEFKARTRPAYTPAPEPIAPRPEPSDFWNDATANDVVVAQIQIPDMDAVVVPEVDAQGRKRVELPYIPPDPSTAKPVKSKIPPNDGSAVWQAQKKHYDKTGQWLPADWFG